MSDLLPQADLSTAPARYDAANRATLEWMLARAPLAGRLINTKLNPLTGQEYGDGDGLRGPAWTYGWIQGRGLEALACFARHYAMTDPQLAGRLRDRLTPLYATLKAQVARDGYWSFLMDAQGQAVYADAEGVKIQTRPADLYGYADIFAAKGLIAAASLIDPAALPAHLDYLARIRDAITTRRFQMNERIALSHEAIAAEPYDHGPAMIMLGAAGMLAEVGLKDQADWADLWITDLLDDFTDPGTDLLRNVKGDDALNAGHGIEFVGFAFSHLGKRAPQALADRLAAILLDLTQRALRVPGIPVTISIATGAALEPYFPWWSLPETIRAAALARASGATQQAALAALQARADHLFFTGYWRQGRGYAYQTLTADGPLNYSPATPDLDPGYHTGLSLLAAASTR